MLTVVGQHVTSRAERPPCDIAFLKLTDESRRLLFSFRRNDPIDCAADTQTGEFGKASSAFRVHANSRCDLFDGAIAVNYHFVPCVPLVPYVPFDEWDIC